MPVLGAVTLMVAVVSLVDHLVNAVRVLPLSFVVATPSEWLLPGTQLTTFGVGEETPSIVTGSPEGSVVMVLTDVAVALGAVNRIALLLASTFTL